MTKIIVGIDELGRSLDAVVLAEALFRAPSDTQAVS